MYSFYYKINNKNVFNNNIFLQKWNHSILLFFSFEEIDDY